MAIPVGQSARSRQLQTLAQGMPVANQAVADQLQQGRQTQLQAAISSAPTGVSTRQAAQQVGAQQAQQAGQIQTGIMEQDLKQQAQLGQLGLAEQAQTAQKGLADRQLGLQQKQRELTGKLTAIDSRLKNELFDKQLSFQRDDMGRTLYNDRQLLDYKLMTAKSDEDLSNYEQKVSQLSKRKLQILEAAYKKIAQTLEQQFTKGQQKLDQAQKKRLVLAEAAMKEKIAREKANAANRGSMFSSAGTIAGAAVGTYYGGPAGGAAGAAVGGGAGSILASTTKI